MLRDVSFFGIVDPISKEFHIRGVIQRTQKNIRTVSLCEENPFQPGTLQHKAWDNMFQAIGDRIESKAFTHQPETVAEIMLKRNRFLDTELTSLVGPVFDKAAWPEGIVFRGAAVAQCS